MSLTESTELRHLSADIVQKIKFILDQHECWKIVAEKITVSPTDKTPLYTINHLGIMRNSKEGPTMTLLNDWATHGRKRPTLGDFIKLLTECEMFRVADYLAMDVLKGSPVPRKNQLSITEELDLLRTKTRRLPKAKLSTYSTIAETSPQEDGYLTTSVSTANEAYYRPLDSENIVQQEQETVPRMSYDHLCDITDDFNDKKITEGGRKLGSGAFSDVFLGYLNGEKVAVKRLKSDKCQSFINEVNVLSAHQHANVLKLLALSISDLSYLCLVYEYMPNGSLEDRLECLADTKPIPWQERIKIAEELAQGINFLHEIGYVHRDVKSANVLLDKEWVTKLGDFGVAHVCPDISIGTSISTIPFGTSPYMPMEGFQGITTVKLDSYSLGVVILELLTGLKPCDPKTNDMLVDIVMEKYIDNGSLLDSAAGSWDIDIATELYSIAEKFLAHHRKDRPAVFELLPDLEDLVQKMRKL